MATITLISSDNEHFEVEAAVANMSQTVRHMIEDECYEGGIPLPNVTAKVLAKVLEYCKKHSAASAPEAGSSSDAAADAASSEAAGSSSAAAAAAVPSKEELESFDKAFLQVELGMLYDLILAANYLEVKGLLDLTCQEVADMIKGKTVEEIRQKFGIKNDFTPEEEAEIRKENSWAFED